MVDSIRPAGLSTDGHAAKYVRPPVYFQPPQADGPPPDDLTELAHLTFIEIEALYGEEIAISAGIANDPDTWELTDEDFAQMRPMAEVFPEFVEAHRAGKVKLPPNPPVMREAVEVAMDSDILSFFKQIGPDWQNNLNNILRIALFRGRPDGSNGSDGEPPA